METTKYTVKYQLSDQPVNRWHRSLRAARRDLRACQRAAYQGGDCQGISLVTNDDSPMPDNNF